MKGLLNVDKKKKLRESLVDFLHMEELKTLASDLNVDWDELGSRTKSGKIIDLIDYLVRQGSIDELISEAIKINPRIKEVLSVEANGVWIPVVIVAMTEKEAEELFDESVFQKPLVVNNRQVTIPNNSIDFFREFSSEISEHKQIILQNNYGPLREDWVPFPELTIFQIINQAINELDCEPLSLTEDFLDENDDTREEAWYFLNERGCVLIIDALSMFHPRIQFLLPQSQLLRPDSTIATLVVSPIDFSRHRVNRLIEREINSWGLAKKRLKDLDILFDFNIGGERSLRRWLITILPETAETFHRKRPKKSEIEKWHKKYPPKSTNIQDYIFSKSD